MQINVSDTGYARDMERLRRPGVRKEEHGKREERQEESDERKKEKQDEDEEDEQDAITNFRFDTSNDQELIYYNLDSEIKKWIALMRIEHDQVYNYDLMHQVTHWLSQTFIALFQHHFNKQWVKMDHIMGQFLRDIKQDKTEAEKYDLWAKMRSDISPILQEVINEVAQRQDSVQKYQQLSLIKELILQLSKKKTRFALYILQTEVVRVTTRYGQVPGTTLDSALARELYSCTSHLKDIEKISDLLHQEEINYTGFLAEPAVIGAPDLTEKVKRYLEKMQRLAKETKNHYDELNIHIQDIKNSFSWNYMSTNSNLTFHKSRARDLIDKPLLYKAWKAASKAPKHPAHHHHDDVRREIDPATAFGGALPHASGKTKQPAAGHRGVARAAA